MDLKEFTGAQRQALLDLAVMGMYSDGHLGAAEQERVGRLLTAMGLGSGYEHTRLFDDAVSRVSRFVGNREKSTAQIRALAQNFTSPDQRRAVHDMLRDVVASDGQVAPQESQFLALVRESLQL